jgi:uncharacterized protein (TIGR00251 family)
VFTLETKLRLKVLAGKGKFSVKWNNDEDFLLITTKSKAKDNKANLEIVKELSRLFKTDVEIVSGFRSKQKLLKLNLSKQDALNTLSTN